MTNAGKKIISGLEDAVAYAKGDETKGRVTRYVTLAISHRDGEGIRIRAMAPYEECYVSGPNKDNVFSDIGPVLQMILHTNHGVKWVKD